MRFFLAVACTAPVAELTVVSFTVPLNGWTIVATATVVTSCSSSGVCVAMSCGGGGSSLDDAYDSAWDSVLPTVVGCVVMSCGGESFFPAGAYDYAWDSVKPMKGKYTITYILYPC